jgi:hypothetical protein
LNTAATEIDEGRNEHSRGSSFVHNDGRQEEDLGTVRQIVIPPRLDSNPMSRDSTPRATIRNERTMSGTIRQARNATEEAKYDRNPEVFLGDMLRPLDLGGISDEKKELVKEMKGKLSFGRGILEDLIASM